MFVGTAPPVHWREHHLATALPLLVVTDADGTLLDADSYSHEAAADALTALDRHRVPLVLCSSKSAAELSELQQRLRLAHPFISENGGAIHIPANYFGFALDGSRRVGERDVVSLGRPYEEVVGLLHECASKLRVRVEGFAALSVEGVVEACGLPPAIARLAKHREHDEPFRLVDPRPGDEARLREALAAEGIDVIAGGRFHHAIGGADKGTATRMLADLYRKAWGPRTTVGLGDAMNDLPLLRSVDIAVIVRGASVAAIEAMRREVPAARVTRARGPAGWREAVLEILGSPPRSRPTA